MKMSERRVRPQVGDFICGGACPATVVIKGEPVTALTPVAKPQPAAPLAEIDRRLRDFKLKLDAFTAQVRAAKRR
jgi:hypothetical protein